MAARSRPLRFAPVSVDGPPAGGRVRYAPVAAGSMLGHALLVAGVWWSYEPSIAPAVRVSSPPAAVVFLDFPASEIAAGPLGGGGVPGRVRGEPVARRPAEPEPRVGRAEEASPAVAASSTAVPQGGAGVQDGVPTDRPRFWTGLRDPRLQVETRALPPVGEREVYAPSTADVVAAIRADSMRAAEAARQDLARRQVTVFGRRVTVGGDSAAAGFRNESIENRRGVQTMWIDGRMWERLQMSNQNDRFVRDSAFRERARATRERNQAARRGGSQER